MVMASFRVAWSTVPSSFMESSSTGLAPPLEPQVLGVSGVQVLLPQASGGWVRRVLVDGLVVVADDLGLREGLVLPVHALVLELLLVGGLVVGPVEDHAGLAGVDGAVGHVDGGQVAGLLELLEEVKAGLQVVDVATGELVGHQVAVEGGASLGGLAVDGHGAGEFRVEQIASRELMSPYLSAFQPTDMIPV